MGSICGVSSSIRCTKRRLAPLECELGHPVAGDADDRRRLSPPERLYLRWNGEGALAWLEAQPSREHDELDARVVEQGRDRLDVARDEDDAIDRPFRGQPLEHLIEALGQRARRQRFADVGLRDQSKALVGIDQSSSHGLGAKGALKGVQSPAPEPLEFGGERSGWRDRISRPKDKILRPLSSEAVERGGDAGSDRRAPRTSPRAGSLGSPRCAAGSLCAAAPGDAGDERHRRWVAQSPRGFRGLVLSLRAQRISQRVVLAQAQGRAAWLEFKTTQAMGAPASPRQVSRVAANHCPAKPSCWDSVRLCRGAITHDTGVRSAHTEVVSRRCAGPFRVSCNGSRRSARQARPPSVVAVYPDCTRRADDRVGNRGVNWRPETPSLSAVSKIEILVSQSIHPPYRSCSAGTSKQRDGVRRKISPLALQLQ